MAIKAKNTGSAQDYTGFRFFSGDEADPIGKYKQPMESPVSAAKDITSKAGNPMADYNIAVGGTNKGNYPADNKNGEITMRGGGAATKGLKVRGPR